MMMKVMVMVMVMMMNDILDSEIVVHISILLTLCRAQWHDKSFILFKRVIIKFVLYDVC